MSAGKTPKIQRCYYCNEVLSDTDLVIKPIPLVCRGGKKRMYKRKFHFDCLPKFMSKHKNIEGKKQESDDWDLVYEYFRDRVMKLPVTSPLGSYATKRLLGLRVGSFMPNATNTRTIKKGYTFQVILAAMKIANIEIQSGFSNQKFKDFEHKVNFALYIINKHINFVQEKLDKVRKVNKATDKIIIKEERKAAYVRKGGKKKFDFV